MDDPIVEEVRCVRDAHAAKFGYDLDAIFRDIKDQELRSRRTFVSFAEVGKLAEPSVGLNPSQHQTPHKAGPMAS